MLRYLTIFLLVCFSVLTYAQTMEEEIFLIHSELDEARRLRLYHFAKNLEKEQKQMEQYKKPGGIVIANEVNDGAKVTWIPNHFDFGDVKQNEKLVYPFKVLNHGSTPYKIKNTSTPCDCMQVYYPKETIMPGEQATVTVIIDASKYKGNLDGGVVLYDNSSPNQRNILYIKGNVLE